MADEQRRELATYLLSDGPEFRPGNWILMVGVVDSEPLHAREDESLIYVVVHPSVHHEAIWTRYWFVMLGLVFELKYVHHGTVISDCDLFSDTPILEFAPPGDFPQTRRAAQDAITASPRGRLADGGER